MFAAVIPAAGTGTRFSTAEHNLPKQYQPLEGEPIYMWSISAFCRNSAIDAIVLVVSQDMLTTAHEHMKNMLMPGKEKISVITGGATRQESVHKGIEHLATVPTPPQYVLIHDAARPFLTQAMIENTIKCVTEHGACTLAIPLTDTIKRVKDGLIEATIDRTALYLIQTPQAAQKQFETTDDAAILEFAGHQVSIVSGSRYNLKITNPEDLKIGEALAPIILKDQQSRR